MNRLQIVTEQFIKIFSILCYSLTMKKLVWNWSTAIGLQQVDGLVPSPYLLALAKRNIEGELPFEGAKNLIDSYYQNQKKKDEREEEADKVSIQIAHILSKPSFNFSVSYLISIHKQLFDGLYEFAGKLRDYDITKREWILDGDTVTYGSAYVLDKALEYDFENEKAFNYNNPLSYDTIKHIASFVAGIWQIHPFGEGNTRTIAVFIIKYLRHLGFKEKNNTFADNSWYFRNALVRANYNNLPNRVFATLEYLERFFRNLLLGEHNDLKNRYTHIGYTTSS